MEFGFETLTALELVLTSWANYCSQTFLKCGEALGPFSYDKPF
jgi:hypothetical protein